jgi:isopentenyldiphosphate isomerase
MALTDNKNELLVEVDELDNPIGTINRKQAHKTNKRYHREVGLALFNDVGEVLLGQRSLKKLHHPGLWSPAVAGHVSAGETPELSVKREAMEEIGIEVEPKYISKLFDRKRSEARFLYIFGAKNNRDAESFISEDFEQFRWVNLADLVEHPTKYDLRAGGLSYKALKKVAENTFTL